MENEKATLKLNIKKKKTKRMASSRIISQQIEGEKVERSDRFPLPGL